MLVEDLDDAREVGKATSEPIDFVDHDNVDTASFDVGDQSLEAWSIGVAAREPSVVVPIRSRFPALAGLTQDIGFARFALGIEAVEGLVEAFF